MAGRPPGNRVDLVRQRASPPETTHTNRPSNLAKEFSINQKELNCLEQRLTLIDYPSLGVGSGPGTEKKHSTNQIESQVMVRKGPGKVARQAQTEQRDWNTKFIRLTTRPKQNAPSSG